MTYAPIVSFVLAAALKAGCGDSDSRAAIIFKEFDVEVRCSDDGECRDAEGNAVRGTDVSAEGILSGPASRFAPNGVYLLWNYSRGGDYVEVELDFPTDVNGEVPSVTSLREFSGGVEVFHTDASRGTVQVVARDSRSRPAAGFFDLIFEYYGPDGMESTGDDEVRFLRYGAFEAIDSDSQRGFDPYDDPYDDPYYDPYYDREFRDRYEPGVRVEIWIMDEGDDYEYNDESGCEGDTYGDDYGDSGGCDGDAYDDDYDGDDSDYDDGSGCSWDGGSGDGCDADTADSDSGGGCDFSCDGDDTITMKNSKKRRSTSFARFMPLFVPFLLRRVLRSRKKK
ncbi:MAG: hypothetical protein ABIJ56_15880 [Pseudomonadota bacterium]